MSATANTSARSALDTTDRIELARRTQLEQIAMVCRSSVNTFGGLIVLGAVIVYLISFDHSWVWGLVWYAVLLLTAAIRWKVQATFLSRERTPDQAAHWRRIILLGVVVTGFIWSVPGTWLLPIGFNAQLFMCGCIMGVAASAAAALAPIKNAFGAFVAPMLLPVAIGKMIAGGDNVAIALGLLLFGIVMLGGSMRYYDDIRKMLRLSVENKVLAERLVAENQRFEQTNATLQEQISVREEIEKSLLAAKAEADEASRAKSQFLANMSHEVRTPLNAIMGMTELLRRTQLNDKQTKFADTAFRSSERLLGIINDILDLARVEAGRLHLHHHEFAPRKWLSEVVDLMGPQAAAKGLTLHHQIDASVPTKLRGDSERLRQILMNLVGNAIKFTVAGEVNVVLTMREQDAAQRMLHCSVSDTGLGISPDAQARLFKPFSQIDDTSTRRFGGTGLGLAISRQLVEAMGGQIGVTSTTGRGSTFWFDVPLEIVEPESHIQSIAPSADAHIFAAHVLVAEDNDINLDLLVEMLNLAGCTVTIARSGADALHKLSADTFDAAIMDWHMPELDGLTAIRLLRAQDKRARTQSKKLPVIALTASAMAGDREACLAAGADDYLSKPFTYQSLVNTLRRWLPARNAA